MTIQLKDLVLIRYKIRQQMIKVKQEFIDLKNMENIADKYITYEGLNASDMIQAQRFKKLHIDPIRTGIFHQKQKGDEDIKQLLLKYK